MWVSANETESELESTRENGSGIAQGVPRKRETGITVA
jgi:hypothetical protein